MAPIKTSILAFATLLTTTTLAQASFSSNSSIQAWMEGHLQWRMQAYDGYAKDPDYDQCSGNLVADIVSNGTASGCLHATNTSAVCYVAQTYSENYTCTALTYRNNNTACGTEDVAIRFAFSGGPSELAFATPYAAKSFEVSCG